MLDIKIQGLRSTILELENLSNVISNFRGTGIWAAVIGELRREVQTVFNSGGYGSWAPRKDNLPHPLLRRTGALFRSYTDANAVVSNQPRMLIFGSQLFYAEYLEEGTRYMPPRPVLGLLLQSDIETRLEQFIDNQIQDRIGG